MAVHDPWRLSRTLEYDSRQVATRHTPFPAAGSAMAPAVFSLVTFALPLPHGVQFCSSAKPLRGSPTKDGTYFIAWRLGFPPPPMLFTVVPSDASRVACH